jgi:hypothetical protein
MKINKSWKELMDDTFDLVQNITVIIGYCDITDYDSHPGESPKLFKDLKKDSFWIVLGNGNNEEILEEIKEIDCDVKLEGEYEFKAILEYYKGDYNKGERGYWEVKHIEFKLIQTLLERDRNEKLNKILYF